MSVPETPSPDILEICSRIAQSGQFDAPYYLKQNPDVLYSGMDPIYHYVCHGAAEGRKPAPWFDAAACERAQHDQPSASGNPFYDFLIRNVSQP